MSRPPAQEGTDRLTLRAVAIVPARLSSTRLPRKMMLRETGRYLFEHTVRNVERASSIERVVLATDAEEIVVAAETVGIEAILTSPDHPSGTDRVHEAARTLAARGDGPWDVIVNVQGDEPELPHADLDTLIGAFHDPGVEIATLFTEVSDPSQALDPSVVKVVVDAHGDALYFSRSPVPSLDHPSRPMHAAAPGLRAMKRHIGVYAFRPHALEEFCALPPGALEQTESLEQLRWLETGRSIRVLEAEEKSIGIDTPGDYALFVLRERERNARATGISTTQ